MSHIRSAEDAWYAASQEDRTPAEDDTDYLPWRFFCDFCQEEHVQEHDEAWYREYIFTHYGVTLSRGRTAFDYFLHGE